MSHFIIMAKISCRLGASIWCLASAYALFRWFDVITDNTHAYFVH